MVNGLAFIEYLSSLITTQSALQYLPHSPIHTHINTLIAEAAMQGASCTSGITKIHQYLVQGHSDMQLSLAQAGGTGI